MSFLLCVLERDFAQSFTILFYLTLYQPSAFQWEIIIITQQLFAHQAWNLPAQYIYIFLSKTLALRHCFYSLFFKIYIISSVLPAFRLWKAFKCQVHLFDINVTANGVKRAGWETNRNNEREKERVRLRDYSWPLDGDHTPGKCEGLLYTFLLMHSPKHKQSK